MPDPALRIVLDSSEAKKAIADLGGEVEKINKSSKQARETDAGGMGDTMKSLLATQAAGGGLGSLGKVGGAMAGGPVGAMVGQAAGDMAQKQIDKVLKGFEKGMDLYADKMLEYAGLYESTGQETIDAMKQMTPIVRDLMITEKMRIEAAGKLLKIEQERAGISKVRSLAGEFAAGTRQRPGESNEDYSRRAAVWMAPRLKRYRADVQERQVLFEGLGVGVTAEERAGLKFWERDTIKRNQEAMRNLNGEM